MNSATIVRANGNVEELTIRPSLKEAQTIVGGWIELVKAKDHSGNAATLVVDEEGRLKGKPINNSITTTYGQSVFGGYIVGDVIVLKGYRTVGN